MGNQASQIAGSYVMENVAGLPLESKHVYELAKSNMGRTSGMFGSGGPSTGSTLDPNGKFVGNSRIGPDGKPRKNEKRSCCAMYNPFAAGKNGEKSCVHRSCSNTVSFMGDPTVMMNIGFWSLRFGFPLMGWFFFVALGKFAAGFGSAFLIFYLISRIDFSSPIGAPAHAPAKEEEETGDYKCPDWISTHRINFAVAGSGGVGKSTLINTLRGIKAKDPLAAPIGVKETTMEPRDYHFPTMGQPWASITNLDKVSLWDLPGVGTQAFPSADYIKMMGLRYFDGVMIVTAERFTQHDIMLMEELEAYNVPYYMVRNKTDQAVEMEFLEYGRDRDVVIADLRQYFLDQNVKNRLYFISAAKLDMPGSEQYRFDFDELLFQIAQDLSTHRKLL